MINNEEEIWKVHPEYAEIEVSSLGRVRTLDKMVWNGWGTWLMKGRVLKQDECTNGYLQVCIKVNGKFIKQRIHRLVAQTFIQNPDNLPQVNHKNCNRADNRASNLEWCSNSYNQKYRNKFGVSQAEKTGYPLFAVNLATNEVLHFRAQREAGRELGIDRSCINNVINGRRNHTGGFWFVNDDGHAVDVVISKLHDIGKTGLKIK